MKNRMRIGLIVAALVVLVGIGWRVSQDNTSVIAKDYPGFVNEEELDIPVEIRAQWEVDRTTAIALLEQDPNDFATLQSLATINKSLGNYAEGRRYIERYLELNAINPASWTILGDIALDMGDYETAQSSYTKSLSLGVDENVFAKMERLWRNHMPERYEDIGMLYEDAIRLDQQRPSYLVRLARWYAEQERWQEAADNMNVAAQLLPGDAAAEAEYREYLQKVQ